MTQRKQWMKVLLETDKLSIKKYLNTVRLELLDINVPNIEDFPYLAMNCCEVWYTDEGCYELLCSVQLYSYEPDWLNNCWGKITPIEKDEPLPILPITIGYIVCKDWKVNYDICKKSLYSLEDVL
jgi:hypothetical protein